LALDGDDWSASCFGCFIPGEELLVPLDRKLGVPQSCWSRCGGEEKKFLHCHAGNWTLVIHSLLI